MDHVLTEAPGGSTVEPTLVESGAWAALIDEPVSVVDRWVVLLERPGGRAGAEDAPESISAGGVRASGLPDGNAAVRDDVPHLWDVIAAWRAADRELALLSEDEPDWNRVHAEVVGLRALHHRLFDARANEESARREMTAVRFAAAARAWWQDHAPRPVPA